MDIDRGGKDEVGLLLSAMSHMTAKLKEIDDQIAYIRQGLEKGLQDADWANTRLTALLDETKALQDAPEPLPAPAAPALVIDMPTMKRYMRDLEKILAKGNPREVKKLLKMCVSKIRMAPEARQVEITYRVPKPFVKALVAGARYKTLRQLMLPVYQRK